MAEKSLLRIFGSESDALTGASFHEVILSCAQKERLAGCTVVRGLASFGKTGLIHSDSSPDYEADLPVVVELVDAPAKIAAFLQRLEGQFKTGLSRFLITEERLEQIR